LNQQLSECSEFKWLLIKGNAFNTNNIYYRIPLNGHEDNYIRQTKNMDIKCDIADYAHTFKYSSVYNLLDNMNHYVFSDNNNYNTHNSLILYGHINNTLNLFTHFRSGVYMFL
jgi:hypothetical protein